MAIIGLVYWAEADEKVRRWLLNALARVGREANCITPIEHVLDRHPHEPQTTAAGIAAIYKLSRKRTPEEVLRRLRYDPQMQVLAALQHVPAGRLDLSALPLDVEKASADLLRLALVVVGLGRSPINLLNPRHTDAEMVKVLGGHHDPIVSQYTVWAITENPLLGVENLGIDLRDLAAVPANVRAWVYQVLSMTAANVNTYFEYVRFGMSDQEDREARLGLALGIRDTYVDILEPLVIDWALNEADPEVGPVVLDHIVRHSDRSPQYAALALEFYEKAAPDSTTRARLEGAAGGTQLYGRFRQVAYDGTGDLFRGMTNVTNNTFNIQGGVQGGAVSMGGTAVNTGDTTVQHYTGEVRQAILTELANAERGVHKAGLEEASKKEALAKIAAAKDDPSPGKVQNVVDALKSAGAIADAGKALLPYATALATAAGLSLGG